VGGNSIQFARQEHIAHVIAIDIDASRLAMAEHNARIYGVAHKIEFLLGDYMQLVRGLQVLESAIRERKKERERERREEREREEREREREREEREREREMGGANTRYVG